MLARIRKAIAAGLLAGAAAAGSVLYTAATEGNINRDEVGKAVGAGVVAAFVALVGVYRIPNATAPAVQSGSLRGDGGF